MSRPFQILANNGRLYMIEKLCDPPCVSASWTFGRRLVVISLDTDEGNVLQIFEHPEFKTMQSVLLQNGHLIMHPTGRLHFQ